MAVLPNYYLLGQISKPVGRAGEMRLIIEDELLDQLQELKHVFVTQAGCKIPYFIDYVKVTDYDVLIKFEDTTDPDTASKFTGKEIYIDEKTLNLSDNADSLPKTSWVGFVLYERNEKVIGTLKDVLEYPSQLMALIEIGNGREALIPLVESWIISLDVKKQKIIMDLPEGILELN